MRNAGRMEIGLHSTVSILLEKENIEKFKIAITKHRTDRRE
jgi:hypothetical protein